VVDGNFIKVFHHILTQKVCGCVFTNNTITKYSDSKNSYSIASTAKDQSADQHRSI